MPYYEQAGLVRKVDADQPIDVVRDQLFAFVDAL
jgi:hypothetical protein